MNFAIRYLTEYRYDAPVTDNLNALRVRPATTANQRVDDFHVRTDPEARLARHTDSPEEILYIVSGSAEAQVGDERGILSSGDLAVVPAMAPHSLRTIGDDADHLKRTSSQGGS